MKSYELASTSSSRLLFYRRLGGCFVLITLVSVFLCIVKSSRSAGTSFVSLHATHLEGRLVFPTPYFRPCVIRDNAVSRGHQRTACRGVSTPPCLKSFPLHVYPQARHPSKRLPRLLPTLFEQEMCMHAGNDHGLNGLRIAELRFPRSCKEAQDRRWLEGRIFPSSRRLQVRERRSTPVLPFQLAEGSVSTYLFLFLRPPEFRVKKKKSTFPSTRPFDHTHIFGDRPAPPTSFLCHLKDNNYLIRHLKARFLHGPPLYCDGAKLCLKVRRGSEALCNGPAFRLFASCSSPLYAGPHRKHVRKEARGFVSPEHCAYYSSFSRRKRLLQSTPPPSAADKLMGYSSAGGWFSQGDAQHRHKPAGYGEVSTSTRDESQPIYSEIDEEDDVSPSSAARSGGYAAPAQTHRDGGAATPGMPPGSSLPACVPRPAEKETASAAGRWTPAADAAIAPFAARRDASERGNFHMDPFCGVAGRSFENDEAPKKECSVHTPPSPFHNHILFDEKVFEKMSVLRHLIFTFESSGSADISSASIDTKYLPLLCEGDLLERTIQLARENYEKQVALQASGDPQQQADIFAAAAEWRQQQRRSAAATATAARVTQQLQQQYESGPEAAVCSPSEPAAFSFPSSSASSAFSSASRPSSFRSEDSPRVSSSAETQQETDGFLQAHAAAKREAAAAAKTQQEHVERQEGCVSSSRGAAVCESSNRISSSSGSSRGGAHTGAAADLSGQPVLPRMRSPVQQLRRFEEVAAQLLLLANFYRRRLAKKKVERLLSLLLVGDPEKIDAAFFTMAEQRQLDAHLLNFVEELIRDAHIKYTTYKNKEALSETALKLLKRRIEAHLELEKHKRQDFVRILSLCFHSRTEKRRAVLKATLYTLEDLHRFQEWLEEGILYGEETGKLRKEQLQIMRALVKDCKQANPVENRFLDRWGEENAFQSDINLQYTWDNIVQGGTDAYEGPNFP